MQESGCWSNPGNPSRKKYEILYTPHLSRNKSKDAAVQTEPTDFFENSLSLPNSAEVWKHPASKDVPVRITNAKRRRLNKEYNWSRYLPSQRFLKFKFLIHCLLTY